jgi:signal transduction histidine kinase
MSSLARAWIQTHLFDHAPFSICIIDRSFRIVDANPWFVQTYGAWRGRRCFAVYKQRSSRCERCGAAETFLDGKSRVREEEGRDQAGQPHYYVVHIIPVVGPKKRVDFAVEVSADITEIKVLEEEKLRAERLAVVGQTVAGLAHGIKNIIMGLEGGMYVMGSGIQTSNDTRIRQGWTMLEDNVARISQFAKEFLSFARGSRPRARLIDPNAVAAKVVGLFSYKAANAGFDFRFRPQAGLAPAAMDEAGIHTCLSNLVSNALDACGDSDKPHPQVTLSTRETDGVIVFEVEDNADGINPELRQKLFTNFFSTKGSGKGTGLGLLTTRRIVQDHGGSVSFDSAEGVGSVFRLEFPRHRLPTLCDSVQVPSQTLAAEGRDSDDETHGQADSDSGRRARRSDLPADRPGRSRLPGDDSRRRR